MEDAPRKSLNWVLAGAVIAALLGLFVCSWATWRPDASTPSSDGARLVGYMAAAMAGGSLLGLIFGIPRARAESESVSTVRFSNNSNLEQISDWLTKILIGAGLVQLAALPGALRSLGDYLAGGLDTENSEAFAVSIVLYGVGSGFFFGYLWSRLKLRVAFESSERAATDASREKVVFALGQAEAENGGHVPPEDIGRAADLAASLSPSLAEPRPVLWVDDNPGNNASLRYAFEAVGIPVTIALSTEEAMHYVSTGAYGLVITDLGRFESGGIRPRAGFELLERLAQSGAPVEVLVYSTGRAVRLRRELLTAGASFVTSSPTKIFSEAVARLGAQARATR